MEELQQLEVIYNRVATFLVDYSFQIIGAVIIVILGALVARRVGGFVEKLMRKHKLDSTLSRFTAAAVKVLLMVMVGVIALGKIGISVTPFVAAIGALGLGAGLALQGMLSNYGAGIAIVVTRPFVVGDTIAVQGVSGIVTEVQLGLTLLINEDGVQISIPNKHIVGEIIHNSFADSVIEMQFDIAYCCDPLQAAELVSAAIAVQPGVSSDKPPQVGIQDFSANGYTLGIRYWVKTAQLFQTRFLANAAIHKALRSHQIVIPAAQREVRMLQEEA